MESLWEHFVAFYAAMDPIRSSPWCVVLPLWMVVLLGLCCYAFGFRPMWKKIHTFDGYEVLNASPQIWSFDRGALNVVSLSKWSICSLVPPAILLTFMGCLQGTVPIEVCSYITLPFAVVVLGASVIAINALFKIQNQLKEKERLSKEWEGLFKPWIIGFALLGYFAFNVLIMCTATALELGHAL